MVNYLSNICQIMVWSCGRGEVLRGARCWRTWLTGMWDRKSVVHRVASRFWQWTSSRSVMMSSNGSTTLPGASAAWRWSKDTLTFLRASQLLGLALAFCRESPRSPSWNTMVKIWGRENDFARKRACRRNVLFLSAFLRFSSLSSPRRLHQWRNNKYTISTFIVL